jgi:hypothetical protein
MQEDDSNWPEPDRVGRQELEINMGNEHISFVTTKIGAVAEVMNCADPEGLRNFHWLVQVIAPVDCFDEFIRRIFCSMFYLFIPKTYGNVVVYSY